MAANELETIAKSLPNDLRHPPPPARPRLRRPIGLRRRRRVNRCTRQLVVVRLPLADALFHEQGASAQIGASMCFAAAVDAAPEPDAAELRRVLPRVLKLGRTDCPKAKPALLSFVGFFGEESGGGGPDLLLLV